MKKAISCLAVILIALFGGSYVIYLPDHWWIFPSILTFIFLGVGGIVGLLALADGAW